MRKCYVCDTTQNLHKHHIYGGTGRRKLSEKYGAVVDLCYRHHNGSNSGVHFNHELDMKLKADWQAEFELAHTREEFRSIFGRSYLD
jgi:hypothetical protein